MAATLQNLWEMLKGKKPDDGYISVPAQRFRSVRPPTPDLPMSIMPVDESPPMQPNAMDGVPWSAMPEPTPQQAMPSSEMAPATNPLDMVQRGPASARPMRGPMAAPPQIKNPITQEQKDAIAEMIAAQQGDIEKQDELVAQAENLKPQIDLRPIAGFVDSMTGGHMAGNLGAPFTQADKLKLLSTLRNQALEGKEKITGQKLRQMFGEGNLDMRTLGAFMSANRKISSDEDRQDKADWKKDQAILQYSRSLETDPLLKDLNKQNLSFGQVDKLIDQAKGGNTVATSALGIKMAKAMGEVGVMTENDIKRYIQSGKLTQAAADKLNKWTSGTPTDATLDEVRQIAGVMRNSMKSNVQPVYDRYAHRLMKNHHMSKQEAYERLDVPFEAEEPAPKEAAVSPKAAPSKGDALSPEEKARLEKLRAAKAARGE